MQSVMQRLQQTEQALEQLNITLDTFWEEVAAISDLSNEMQGLGMRGPADVPSPATLKHLFGEWAWHLNCPVQLLFGSPLQCAGPFLVEVLKELPGDDRGVTLGLEIASEWIPWIAENVTEKIRREQEELSPDGVGDMIPQTPVPPVPETPPPPEVIVIDSPPEIQGFGTQDESAIEGRSRALRHLRDRNSIICQEHADELSLWLWLRDICWAMYKRTLLQPYGMRGADEAPARFEERLLILDTEGLMSLEAEGGGIFDAQLALMAMACSHLVIINHKGELSRQLQDLLEVCLFAMQHLKVCRIQPKLLFVLRDQHDRSHGVHGDALRLMRKHLSEASSHLQLRLDELISLDPGSSVPSSLKDALQRPGDRNMENTESKQPFQG
eukprot:s401_g8.t1